MPLHRAAPPSTRFKRLPLPTLLVCMAGLCLGAQEANADTLTPPPGMVTGAWGQSQQQAPVAASVKSDKSDRADKNTETGAGAANDSVNRFLQEHGIVAQAQSNTLLNQVRDTASDLVLSAMNFLGVPYRRGGSSEANGFDCSGFTRHIFEMSVGLILPRRADEQARMSSLTPIKREELKPGDLVFFNTMRQTFSHVGIYVGDGKFIHSPRTGAAVRVEDMREAYWAKRFTGARRADLSGQVAAHDSDRDTTAR